MTTDATLYVVETNAGWYQTKIGFVYENHTDRSVSQNYCRTPGPPVVEKYESGKWTAAYIPIVLLCLTMPPFVIAADSSYTAILDFTAAPPNTHKGPELRVAAIPGIYRLRWAMRAGSDPNAEDAPMVDAVSNQFRLVLR